VGITEDVYEKLWATESARAALENTPGVDVGTLAVSEEPVRPETLDTFDAILAGGLRVTPASLVGIKRCTLIVRFGAGYDRVDLDACSDAGVIVATTPEGIRRAMSVTALTHILALSTKLFLKARCTHEGRWYEAANVDSMGMGLTGRTVGYVGFGNIGQDLYRLLQPLEMHHLVSDPYLNDTVAASFDIERVELAALLTRADFVVVLCLLTEETRHLIGAEQLRQMKETAYLINVARGPIIDQRALAQALAEGQIAGAGLDALDPEPIEPDDPLLSLDNANVTPHAMGYTDEMVRLCSELCVEAALRVRAGQVPASVINRTVLDRANLKAKMDAYRLYGAAG
jgi:D-3-phosphoglycerate dehydrogenase